MGIRGWRVRADTVPCAPTLASFGLGLVRLLRQSGHEVWDKRMTRGMQAGRQTTLREQVAVSGIGIHSGSPGTVTLHPAEADTGIVFSRSGVNGGRDRELCANFRSVTATEFATVLGDKDGPAVSTTEHVLAALYGLGVDNAIVEVDGPEVPIMDGSAAPFVEAIDQAGIVTLSAPRRCIKVLKPVRVEHQRLLRRTAPVCARPAHRNRNRIRSSADRPAEIRRSMSSPQLSAANWRRRAPSASCAT